MEQQTPKVKFETMIGVFGDGGFKLPDICSIHTAQKIYWIRNLLSDSNSNQRI